MRRSIIIVRHSEIKEGLQADKIVKKLKKSAMRVRKKEFQADEIIKKLKKIRHIGREKGTSGG